MWKTLVSGLCGFLLSAISVGTAHAQLTSLTEGFDTVGSFGPTPTGIFANGWVNVNNSDIPNTTAFNWEQGDSGTFIYTAQSPAGSTTSFAQVSFLSTNGTVLSDWLLTPVLNLEAGATISFYTAAVKGTTFANDLQVYISSSGSSTSVGSDAQTPTGGVFTLLPNGDLNPTLAVHGYPDTPPNGWTLETFTLTSSEVSTPTSGRIGLRYFIPNTAAPQGSEIGVDTFSFADPTIFTRTVSGNWIDTKGWTPNGIPNGNTVTAQLVNPSSVTNNTVDLGGGTFTVNQLQFFGSGAGTWSVANGTIIFDGTNPTFVNQGGSSGIVGRLPAFQLNANTTFEIDNPSAVTEVTGTISGTGQLTKTGSGTLVLIGTNTYSGGTTISAGTLQIGNGGATGSITGDVTDNGTLAFDRSDTVVFGGVISGTGSLGQLASGTLVLTGTNTYTGGTTISAGTLQIGNGGTTGSITGNVTDNGTLAFDRSDAVTFAGAISGTGSLAQLGSGTLTLTGTNTYAGGTTISAGTLQLGDGVTNGSITGHVTDNGTLVFDPSSSVTLSGVISGTGSLVKLGSGTAILTGTNTYAGGTTISAGTLQLGDGVTNGNITGNITDNGTLAFDPAGSVSFGGVISGTGNLVKLGSGTAILTGTNTYAGGTTISAGTLQLGDGVANGSITGNITDNGTLAFDPSGVATFAGVISGTGTLVKLGSGTTILTGTNTYAGGTTISAGTLQLGDGVTNGSITGNVTDNGTLALDPVGSVSFGGVISGTGTLVKLGIGTAILTGTNTYAGGTTVSAGTLQLGDGVTNGSIIGNVTDNGTLVFDPSSSVTLSGVISGTGSLVKLGSGTAILTGTNNYSGGTTISTGTLQLGDGVTNGSITGNVTDNGTLAFDPVGSVSFGGVISGTGNLVKLGSGTAILTGTNTNAGGTIISAGTLQLGDGIMNGSITGNVTDNGTLAFDPSGSVTFAAVISGTGNLVELGSGTAILTGTNTYAGGTTISAGTLQLGDGLTNGSITGSVTDNGRLALDPVGSVSFGGVISGTGTLVKLGSGTAILTGTDTYAGGTTISAGTLQLGDGVTNGSITGNVTDNGTLVFDPSSSATLSGVISGTGSLVKLGSGTAILTGTNTYAGGTTVSAGTLQLGDGVTNGSFTGNITDNGTLAFDPSGAAAFGAVISGIGNLVKLGGGTAILTGTNTYAGGTTISAGTLQLGDGVTNGSITGNVTDNGTLALDPVGSVTFGGVISGTGTLVKLGRGTAILTGTNTYAGGTTISAGTLQLGDGVTNGSITGNVTDNGTLVFDPSSSVTLSGVISGTGTLAKLGSGTAILTGTNTYSGGTTIRAGTLQLGDGVTNGSITGNVTDNGTLAFDPGGSAILSGVISGTGNLVKLGSGTVILTGTNTYTGGTAISAGTLQLGDGVTNGSITGNITDNGTLAFDPVGSVIFSGTIGGSGGLTQSGSGTLILTGTNPYSGGTNLDGGIVAINSDGNLGTGVLSFNGGTLESLAAGGGIVSHKQITLQSGGGTFLADAGTSSTLSGAISGVGSLTKDGAGTLMLSGANTYLGGTIVNAGTLTVNNAQALGLGSVVVNGGILTADPQPINVKGNYTQNAGGTLLLQVAGANAGQYDFLSVAGNANLGGTLQLISLGYLPKAGDLLTLVTAGGIVSGRFARFVDPFTTGPGLNTIDLVYGRNSVELQFLNVTGPISPVIPTVPTTPPSPPGVPPKVVETMNFASFALTPNQIAAAHLLDQLELNPSTANLIGFLFKEPLSNLPGDLQKISPAGLTAFYEIGFSGANIQKLNLEGRFDDIRNGASGFNSNMRINGAAVNLGDKGTEDGKSLGSTVEPILQPGPQNRWGVWVTGFGDFVEVDADSNAAGYNFTTGGFSLGVDYRILDTLAFGVMGDYSHTWTELNPAGHIDVDTGRGGIYATLFSHGFYLNGGIYGGHNTYETSRAGLEGAANGNTEGAEFSAFIGGGYDLHFGHLSGGPIASLQYTYVNIDGFSEKGSLAPLQIHSGSAESLRTDFGFRASYQWQIGKILVEPAFKAAWEHEYKYSALPIIAGFAGIPGPSATFFGPAEGHNSAVVSAGITAQWTPTIATYVNYDGQLGRDRYDSNAVTGGVRITF